jgi:hypothetical protein
LFLGGGGSATCRKTFGNCHRRSNKGVYRYKYFVERCTIRGRNGWVSWVRSQGYRRCPL